MGLGLGLGLGIGIGIGLRLGLGLGLGSGLRSGFGLGLGSQAAPHRVGAIEEDDDPLVIHLRVAIQPLGEDAELVEDRALRLG